MSWLSKNVVSPATNVLTALTGIGGTKGPQNPYPRPDLSYLADTSKLDYLKDPTMYSSLLDTSGYDFLKNPSTAAPTKTFAGTYQAPGYGKSDSMYQSLIDSTNAPSSVDDVRQQLNSDQLNQLLAGIDTDTKNTVGSLKSDFADRGLGGPGMLSDIEANSLAQAYDDANKTKASARTTLGQSTLDLLKNRETQNIAARTAAAGAAGTQDAQANQIAATGGLADVNAYNTGQEAAAGRTNTNQLNYANLLNTDKTAYNSDVSSNNQLFAQLLNARDLGAAGINSTNYNTGTQQQYQDATPGWLDQILRNIKLSVGPAQG